MKNMAREYKNDIKKRAQTDETKSIAAGCFDLQQVLNCPKGEAS